MSKQRLTSALRGGAFVVCGKARKTNIRRKEKREGA